MRAILVAVLSVLIMGGTLAVSPWLLSRLYLNLGTVQLNQLLYQSGAAKDLVASPGFNEPLDSRSELIDGDRLSAASGYFREALRWDTRNMLASYNLGLVDLLQGDWRAAEAAWQEVIGLDPSFAMAHFQLARLYERRGEKQEAAAHWRAARATPYLMAEGVRFSDVGDFERALEAFQTAVMADPIYAKGYEAVGGISQRLGRVAEAEAAYWAAVDLYAPDNPRYYLAMGYAYSVQERWDDAISAFERAIALDPSNYEAYFRIGVVWRYGRQDLEQALPWFERAYRWNPRHLWTLLEIGGVYHGWGDLDAAAKWYARAAEVEPRSGRPLALLGLLATQRGAPQEAVPLLQRAVEKSDQDPDAYLWLGQAYRQVGNLDQAEQALRAAMALAPARADLHLELAEALHDKGDDESARHEYQRVLELHPGDQRAQEGLAELEGAGP
ncbi:MAG: tetratricopeptide repeat protein [Chloroflexi bacterium]|nr:tetratricopeptide repeat protein [Chloroflexota bacterium]